MGNNNTTSPGNHHSVKEVNLASSCKKNSEKENILRIKFQDIERKYNILVNADLGFTLAFFKEEIRKIFRIPRELEMRVYVKDKQGEKSNGIFLKDESELQAYKQKLIHITMTHVVENQNIDDYLVFVEILRIRDDTYQYIRFQTFNFLPLKHLTTKSKERYFRPSDSGFADPLDMKKSTKDFGFSKKVFLTSYTPQEEDTASILLYFNNSIQMKKVDKFLRISEFTANLNAEMNINCVLCNYESSLKIDDNSTFAMLLKHMDKLKFSVCEIETYFYNHPPEKPVLPDLTIVEKPSNQAIFSIDMPD